MVVLEGVLVEEVVTEEKHLHVCRQRTVKEETTNNLEKKEEEQAMVGVQYRQGLYLDMDTYLLMSSCIASYR